MRFLLSYTYHFVVSNSRHGTHSPFVYALAEKVIYNPSFKSASYVDMPDGLTGKFTPLLRNILAFWKLDRLSADLEDQTAPAYWVDAPSISEESILQHLHRGKVVFLHKPYARKHRSLWQNLIADERVVVSINLFYFGILIHRSGQRKEDFLLRYPGI